LLNAEEIEFALNSWEIWGRAEQQSPQQYKVWLILAGRGWGKTYTGAQWVHKLAFEQPNARFAIVGANIHEAQHIMVEGESGLTSCAFPWNEFTFIPTQQKLQWANGSIGYLCSGANPEALRGHQFHYAWCDELAKWEYAQASWDNLMLALRLGDDPKTLVTTTPKPLKLLSQLINDDDTFITTGSTYDNADNLATGFLATIKKQYEGSQLGEQELHGKIIKHQANALWQQNVIDDNRVYVVPNQEAISRIIISVDPAVTNNSSSDETGIMVMCRDANDHIYLLEDLSGKYQPTDWVAKIINSYHSYQADCVIAETNMGGDLVRDMLLSHDKSLSFKAVRATRGKYIRAEPVANLYKNGLIHHVGNDFNLLEQQLVSYTQNSKKSPDRLDALVWGVYDLLLDKNTMTIEPRISIL
jgi:phage terminase large subunit-like protein